jgi:cell wall-associated NlpC family hydrolase
VAAALGTAAVALTASTAPQAIVSSVEVTTGNLPVVSPNEDPPTVILPRLDAAEAAAEALKTARRSAPTTTPARPSAPAEPTSLVKRAVRPSTAPHTSSVQQRITEAAHTYVGRRIPYRYGGKTCTANAGCDCSALVWRVLQDAGIDAPYRSSAALKRWATPVSKANAVPGDLVLFPGHVGIYAGNNMLVDHGGPGRGANYRHIWGVPRFARVPS